jgi:DNA helicase-2/ATP-dependent DNA helicase PcrA
VNIILAFERDHPGARIVKLEQNYRSTQNILDAAYHVVRNNRGRKDKRLWTENQHGEEIILHEAMNEQEEAVFVASTILEGKRTKKRELKDHAILYRTNAQSRVLKRCSSTTRSRTRSSAVCAFTSGARSRTCCLCAARAQPV